jgi:glycosyltransferase involved in cell wall biosynthesis
MKNPLVSVVIAVCNGEKYIKRAVESVVSQTYLNMEIIIIDDSSGDNTPQIISELKKNDPRIIILTNETNLGFVKTLNKGIASSRGKYIARLDDDDIWSDCQKIEKQVSFLEKNNDYVLTGGGVIVRKERNDEELIRYLFPETDEEIRKGLFVDNLFAHSSVVFSKMIFEKAGGYNEKFGFFADRDLWLKMGLLGKFYNFQEYFLIYSDKESGGKSYSARNLQIRRKLFLRMKMRWQYRKYYKGFLKSFLYCLLSFIYSFLPYKEKIKLFLFKLRIKILGAPYKYKYDK